MTFIAFHRLLAFATPLVLLGCATGFDKEAARALQLPDTKYKEGRVMKMVFPAVTPVEDETIEFYRAQKAAGLIAAESVRGPWIYFAKWRSIDFVVHPQKDGVERVYVDSLERYRAPRRASGTPIRP
ncbi:hypothetical protein ACXR0O_08225 [Verrucomicrobiota bacterium sgz303538]